MATQPIAAITAKSTAAITKESDTLHWKNNPDEARRRKNSLTWKEINAESQRKARSDSSSYSENSDSESSTSTSLCDDENNIPPSLDSTPVRKRRNKESAVIRKLEESAKSATNQNPTTLIVTDTTSQLFSESVTDEKAEKSPSKSENLAISAPAEGISSISQLSPMPDISSYFSTAISPIKSPSNYYDFPDFSAFSIGLGAAIDESDEKFEVSEQGVTNEFFERVTSSMPPSSTSSSSAATVIAAVTQNNSAIKLKHVKQKSLSMEEEKTYENREDLFRINRSFSDGTIISNDAAGGDILQRIISENSKILTRFSNDSLTSSTRTAIVETILEEGKSSEENSSECEEIAAIDAVEECPSTSIQDIADIALESQKSDTKPSATLSLLTCNATQNDDDDVTVQNEKSMNGENSKETLATLHIHTTCNAPAAAATALTLNNNDESFAQKSLPLKDVRLEEAEVISPKFNEISDLVDKLKRVMESDLEKTQEVKPSDSSVTNVNNAEVKVVEEIEVKDEGDNNKSDGSNKEAVSVKITINCENENAGLETKVDNDLGKSSHEQEIKIDDKIESETKPKNDSQLEKCQPIDVGVVNNEKIKPAADEEVATKDSEKILEKLNYQLQRYEDTEKSPTSVVVVTRTPSNERTTDYKKELEVLLKEREIEKRSKSPTYRYEESPQPPPSIVNSSPSPYDHEPRNEIRRRDIASLESTQQMRRPFKSSPSSSLSSSPSNIHSTLSSIQNTIKTLDSACQRSEIYNYKKLDKAMESIEKICESDREWHFYKRTKNFESPPSFKIDDILSSPSTSKPRGFIDERDLSPIRSNFLRYESENNASRKPKTPELDPHYLAKLRCLSTEEYIAGRKSPLGLSPSREKAPVDRYSRIDRSPTSPSLSSRFLKSPTGDRASKSAENSPSRYGGESNLSTRYTRYSPSTSHFDMDIKAESMSNLSFKSSALTENNKKYYEFEWEKTSNRRKYDI
jgi:hypothetical protein